MINPIVASTWTCAELPLPEALRAIHRAGYRAVEVWADTIHLDPRDTSLDIATLRDAVRRTGIRVHSVHLPFREIAPGEPDARRARAWIELCRSVLDRAAGLGAEVAVAHPVTFGALSSGARERTVDALREISAHAQRLEIRLVLENMHTLRGPALGRHVKELLELVAGLPGEVGVCLDVGHCVFNGFVGFATGVEVQQAGAHLRSTHINDNDQVGKGDPHLIPGDGIIDWSELLRAFKMIGYQGGYVLEVRGGVDPEPVLVEARTRFERFLAES